MRVILLAAAKAIYILSTCALFLLAVGFVVYAVWQIFAALPRGALLLDEMLGAVGLTVIGLAVCDVGRFLLQEELAGEKELATTNEVRRTLAKFLTIIIVAATLHALLFIFEAGRQGIASLIYPAALLGVVAILLAALGLYQRLTHAAEHELRIDLEQGRQPEPEESPEDDTSRADGA